jgi:hypothetical protein
MQSHPLNLFAPEACTMAAHKVTKVTPQPGILIRPPPLIRIVL